VKASVMTFSITTLIILDLVATLSIKSITLAARNVRMSLYSLSLFYVSLCWGRAYKFSYSYCHDFKCHWAECHYSESHYAECCFILLC
jgi:hypothetical protein